MENKDKIILTVSKFLRKNGALERYCFNAKNYHNICLPPGATPKEVTKVVMTALVNEYTRDYGTNLRDFISRYASAFSWCDTIEGYDYWEKIDRKWRSNLHSISIRNNGIV